MKRVEFKRKLQNEFPEVSTVIHDGEWLAVRVSSMIRHYVKAETKSTWTEANLKAILESMRKAKDDV